MNQSTIIQYLKGTLDLVYPNNCSACGLRLFNQEKIICLKCDVSLPRTSFHLLENNPIEQLFWGRVPLVSAAAYFQYFKGSQYKNLLHQLKYKGRSDIGEYLGYRYGRELDNANAFSTVDAIVPVPLHPKKEKARGFNQSLHIAMGLSRAMNRPIISNNLIRTQYNESQTRRGRFERWENVSELFQLKSPEELRGKHILLVDDVVTTGATIEACAQALLKAPDSRLSIVALAYASS